MSETQAQVRVTCAVCGFPRDGHDVGIPNEHAFITVDDFLHRVPGAYDNLVPHALALAMPDAGTDEYLSAALETAARLYWLLGAAQDAGQANSIPLTTPEPTTEWLQADIQTMRAMLENGGPLPWDEWRWKVLTLLNIPRKFHASSAAHEAAARERGA